MRRTVTGVLAVAGLASAVILLPAILGCGKKSEETSSAPSGGTTPAESTSMAAPANSTTASAATEKGSGGDPAKGKVIFDAKCSTCHGPQGHGDGPAGAALNPKPRDFHDAAYMSSKSDDEFFHSIKYGKSGMPAWGQAGLSDDDIRNALAYEHTFSKK